MKNPVQLTRELPEHSARFALSTGKNRLARAVELFGSKDLEPAKMLFAWASPPPSDLGTHS